MIRRIGASSLGFVLIWALLAVIAQATRPLWPIDETRYVAAAWEMWTRGDFLVPHLNGAAYAHKPPLMFWAIQAGWGLFGVNEWWPRLVSPLAGLGALFAARALARALWPQNDRIAHLVPWLLLGGLFWSLFSTVTMFDMWNALLATLGVLGLAIAAKGQALRGFMLLGAAIGLGVLAKGPVILLYLMPAALSAPWWLPESRKNSLGRWLGRWYLGVAAALALGAAISLAWALPAASAGGEAYAQAIFWGQTAGRIEDSFAHGRPWWWYLPLLPLLLFPWSVWPSLWRGLLAGEAKALIPSRRDWQLRLALVWFAPAFVAFCFISAKQPHYMLPLFPALALLAAHRLARRDDSRARDGWLPGLMIVALGVGLAGLTLGLFTIARQPDWVGEVSPMLGLAMIGAGLAVMFGRWSGMALAGPMVIALIHLFIVPAAAPAYDLRAAARYIAEQQAVGRPVAIRGEYHSQFHFLGRLTTPIEALRYGSLQSWIKANPEGRIITTFSSGLPDGEAPEFSQAYRGRVLAIWTRRGVEGQAELLR
jgi:4-amino-4-deoxy-L-arabinose transferase-like glycosyltransferase